MKTLMKWTVAVGLSLLAHAGAAALFQPENEEVTAQVAGGEAMEVTLLGNAFEETLQAGNPTEQPIDPLETPPEEVQPVEETAQVEEIRPVETEIPSETATDVQPVEADVVLPAEDIPPMIVADAEVTATVSPVETVIPEEKPEIQPVPEEIEKPKEKPPEEKPKKKVERKKPVKQKAGDAGQNVVSTQKGQADGAADAKASTSSGKKGNMNQQAGNAAASNYPGKIRSKLNRAFRYPNSAKREGLRGTAQVRFTVSSGGSLTGVSIAKSAGFPILDQAAIEAVQRAAPFPKIPDGAGKSSWTFTIPLAFGR
ncbi:protein TonB [Pararhizobium capsulatum DSM 1112]|uniref:Protein TonB n=1 Tax=Pararhizobium capsulatum DSM 1112 TaxID=1121113 RepID=A0ABU0BTR6_9HYPH|nr:energy transducer TonB [Pararhizobium capsulatum]MDQ0321362.1 protein TonB [Pararhizobium capsulatum DSM 1112]